MAGEPDGKSIIIDGKYFPLGGKVKVVTFNDPGTYPAVLSFHSPAVEQDCLATGGPCHGPRFSRPGQRVTTFDQLVESVDQVVLHIDGCHDAAMCFRVLRSRSLSTHFIIDWDGVIYQCLDVMQCGYHAGQANNKSVGIDLNNMMRNLVREPNAPMYPPDHPRIDEMMKKEFRRPKSEVKTIAFSKVQSYGFTEPQYVALIELLRVLIGQDCLKNIANAFPMGLDGEVIYTPLEDPSSHKGYMAHWHWESQRWDPGPQFDWGRVYHSLSGRSNEFPIELEEGKNIGTLLEPKKVREHAEDYYRNNETMTRGWYPMGPNQTWHGGIHLHGRRGDPVRAMIPGTVVAARFGKAPSRLGHNNFLLLRHTVPMAQPAPPGSDEPPKTKDLVFFSLYMHLDTLDVTEVTDASPQWLRKIVQADEGEAGADDDALKQEADPDDFDIVDDIEDDLPFDPSDPDAIDPAGWLEVGTHLAALRRGQVAKILYEEAPIIVGPGEIIGAVGMFGNEGEWEPQIHIEIFADSTWKDAVDMGVHSRFFTELPADVSQNIFVENREILSLFGRPSRRTSALVPQRVLDTTQIENFWFAPDDYQEEKRYMRRLVTRHVSEWSDQVDWVLSLSNADGWDNRVREFRSLLRASSIGREAITSVLPFIWLSKDVAEHIGLDVDDWRGQLDHFHPIHFLLWLMYNSVSRVQGLALGMSKRDARRQAQREEEEHRRCAQIPRPEDCAPSNTEEFVPSAIEMVDDFDYFDAGEELDSWFSERDQGEWRRPPRKGEN